LIGRVARYTPSSTYVLNPDILQKLFDKPNEQSQACLDSAMARKGGRWTNLFDKPNEQSQDRLSSAMARKGGRWAQYDST
ncbi:MAG: hypothetical protein SPG93_03760, partial [Prevotella sp.]|nr:hypothetical protein [Prevotella sp.]